MPKIKILNLQPKQNNVKLKNYKQREKEKHEMKTQNTENHRDNI